MDYDSCDLLIAWVCDRTLDQAWNECPRGDWMLFLAARLEIDRNTLVLAACACARVALKYLPSGEDRPHVAIETAEKWTRGEASLEKVRSAAYAVADIVDDIDNIDSVNAAEGAIEAALYADAARTICYGVDDACVARAAFATDDATHAEMADLVRSMIPYTMIAEAMQKEQV